MSRARWRRWARTAGRGAARVPPWALQVGAVGGQVRPSGAAAAPLQPRFLVQRDQEAPRAAPWALFRARRRRWARAAGLFLFFSGWCSSAPSASPPPQKSDFFNYGILRLWRRGLSRHIARYLQPTFVFESRSVLPRTGHFYTFQGKGADLTPPCVTSLASPHRPKASDGSLEPRRREYL
jgi:hypothetical protein